MRAVPVLQPLSSPWSPGPDSAVGRALSGPITHTQYRMKEPGQMKRGILVLANTSSCHIRQICMNQTGVIRAGWLSVGVGLSMLVRVWRGEEGWGGP